MWGTSFGAFTQGLINSLIIQCAVLLLIWVLVHFSGSPAWSQTQQLAPIDYSPLQQSSSAIQRDEIQRFFTQHEGNSVRTSHWLHHYFKKPVQWQGQVYQVKHYPDSHRVELLVKVLSESVLYDTVVVIEGRTDINSFIQKGTTIQFSGTIFNGVDSFGVKEVQVLVHQPQAIQPVGDMPVNWQGRP